MFILFINLFFCFLFFNCIYVFSLTRSPSWFLSTQNIRNKMQNQQLRKMNGGRFGGGGAWIVNLSCCFRFVFVLSEMYRNNCRKYKICQFNQNNVENVVISREMWNREWQKRHIQQSAHISRIISSIGLNQSAVWVCARAIDSDQLSAWLCACVCVWRIFHLLQQI